MNWRTVLAVVGMAGVSLAAGVPTTGPVKGEDVLGYLDRVTDWYRRVEGAGEDAGSSQEAVLHEQVRANARQAVGLAFDFARAEAAMIDAGGSNAATKPSGQRGAGLAKAAAGAEERVAGLEREVTRVDGEIAGGAATTRPGVVADRDRAAAQLNLARAQRDVMKEYSQFVTTAEAGDAGATVSKRVDDLEAALPEVESGKPEAAPATTGAPAEAFRAESAGVFALLGRMFALSGRMSELNGLAADAQHLRDAGERFRTPIRAEILAATRPAAAGADARTINDLADRFKRLAAAGVPLGEQQVLLDAARASLLTWRGTLSREYETAIKYLLIRAGAMAGVLVLLIAGSELWRRATYRYVQDVRRRRQLMLVRRIVVAAVVVMIVIAGVMTEFGSLATFAGLITAGIAVALQTVILSGVAYFFFIGRFGVRVGDRVTISGITGDVIEIGILRLYLSELAGTPTDLHATGRIVVFSNSVLFQPSAFYKQMPGANYVWHEIAFTLSPGADVGLAERRMVSAVEREFEGWRAALDRGIVVGGTHLEEGELKPEGRLKMTGTGVDLVLRYPVEVRRAAEQDDRVTRALLTAVAEEPKLSLKGGVIQGA